MRYDVIILAGGLGTRLQTLVHDLPKPMAEVASHPFLHYILKSLNVEQTQRIVLSVGYKHEVIREYIGEEFRGIPVQYAIEHEPLGTGGGIALAMSHCTEEKVLILNGDTYFNVEVSRLWDKHVQEGNKLTLGVKYIEKPDRYGSVVTDAQSGRILQFKEKEENAAAAFINAGVYLIERDLSSDFPVTPKWSFEKDFLEKELSRIQIGTAASAALFIDIGIPEDYLRAQELFKQKEHKHNWSEYVLLLDRDGVINQPKANDYVKEPKEFLWTEHALEALYLLRRVFKSIYVVTNQQGIGRELMSEKDLEDIHLSMHKVLINNHIDYFNAVFYAPYLAKQNHPWRKPGTGMPDKATVYEQSDSTKWVMVGDSPGDMKMGTAINAIKVRINNSQFKFDDQDLRFDSLHQFALYITQF